MKTKVGLEMDSDVRANHRGQRKESLVCVGTKKRWNKIPREYGTVQYSIADGSSGKEESASL